MDGQNKWVEEMRKLIVFNHVTLDGYFVDRRGIMTWAQGDSKDAEWQAFVMENSQGGGTPFFGRVTYEIMSRC